MLCNSKAIIAITSPLSLWICPDAFLWTTNFYKVSCHLFYIIHGLGSFLIFILQYLFMINSFMMHSCITPKFLDLYGALVQENGFMISFLVIISFEMPYSSNKKLKYFALSVKLFPLLNLDNFCFTYT